MAVRQRSFIYGPFRRDKENIRWWPLQTFLKRPHIVKTDRYAKFLSESSNQEGEKRPKGKKRTTQIETVATLSRWTCLA